MDALIPYTNKVEVTGLTKDNAYHTVDLSSFMQNPGAVGVIVQYENTGSTWKPGGYKSTGATLGRRDSIEPGTTCIFVAKLDSSDQMDYLLFDSYVDMYLLGELHGPGVVLFDSDSWVYRQGSGNSWSDHTITVIGSDTVADVECALMGGAKENGSRGNGLRCKGATVEPIYSLGSRTGCFPLFCIPVKVNSSGVYQHYFTQGTCELPTVSAVEMGYIKKGYGFYSIFEPEDEGIPANTDWEDHTVTTVKRFAEAAWMLVHVVSAATVTASVRTDGSTNSADELYWSKWPAYPVGMELDKVIEARKESGYTIDFLVWGYLSTVIYGANTLTLNSGTLEMDTGSLTFG